MELTLNLDDRTSRAALFGPGDCNLRLIRGALGVHISARDSLIKLTGEAAAVHNTARVIHCLQEHLRKGRTLTPEVVSESIASCSADDAERDGLVTADALDALDVFVAQNPILARTDGQREYVRAMSRYDLTICLGPAGTGKTYLAVAMAVSLLKKGTIQRIILVRPAVEAGEKLGYLPGDMQAKVNPYLRPLFDAMHDMMSFEQLKRFMQNDVVEVVPLAFMRGRTLNRAVVILDEAQNTTPRQMLMFLTRMGHQSKMIVTGDDSQSDLECGPSGLFDGVRRLRGIRGIAIIRLRETDIVRHELVQQIVVAYDQRQRSGRGQSEGGEGDDSRTVFGPVDAPGPAVDDDRASTEDAGADASEARK